MKPDVMPHPLQAQCPWLTRLDSADTFWKRAVGLISKSGLEPGHGLLIPNCGSVHTCFMRFPIDVIFLDNENRVIKILRGVKPWRMAWGGRRARSVIEVQSGWLERIFVLDQNKTDNEGVNRESPEVDTNNNKEQ